MTLLLTVISGRSLRAKTSGEVPWHWLWSGSPRRSWAVSGLGPQVLGGGQCFLKGKLNDSSHDNDYTDRPQAAPPRFSPINAKLHGPPPHHTLLFFPLFLSSLNAYLKNQYVQRFLFQNFFRAQICLQYHMV